MATGKQKQPGEFLLSCRQALQQARAGGDERHTSLALANLGFALFRLRKFEDGLARFDEAVDMASVLQDVELQAQCLGVKVMAFQDMKRLPDAYKAADEILRLGQAHNNASLQCDALLSQGQILLDSGEPMVASDRLQDARQIALDLGDKRRQMNVLGVLGHIGLAIAASEQAEVYFEQAQSLAVDLEDRQAEIGFLGNRAILMAWRGQHTAAATAFEQVLACAQKTDDQDAEMQALLQLVKAYGELKDDEKVIACAARGLELDGDIETLFAFYESQILAYQRANQPEAAQSTLDQAVTLVQSSRDRSMKVELLLKLGELCLALSMPDKGVEIYADGLRYAIPLNRQRDQVHFIQRIGDILVGQANDRQIIARFEPLLPLVREQQDQPSERTLLHYLIKAYAGLGQTDNLIEVTRRALDLALETRDDASQRRYEDVLIETLFNQARYREVVELINAALKSERFKDDKATRLKLLLNLGDANYELNALDEAMSAYKAALPLPIQLEQREMEARILGRLGSLYAEQGDLDRSVTYTSGALALARQIEDRPAIGELLCMLALSYRDLGQISEAVDCCQQAVATFEEIGVQPFVDNAQALLNDLQPIPE